MNDFNIESFKLKVQQKYKLTQKPNETSLYNWIVDAETLLQLDLLTALDNKSTKYFIDYNKSTLEMPNVDFTINEVRNAKQYCYILLQQTAQQYQVINESRLANQKPISNIQPKIIFNSKNK